MSQPAVPAPEMSVSQTGRMLVLAIGMGIGGALVASLFLAIMTVLQDAVWKQLPQQLGLISPPLWYVAGFAVLAAALVAIAQRLPGHTGGSPITGLHFNVGPREIASVALAAMASLVFAMPLGPEAPLIACGTALGGLIAARQPTEARQLAMVLGGAAAIGAILGNPFISAFMFLEFAALGVLPAAALVPILVSLGTGFLVMSGLGPYTGLGTHELSVSGLTAVDRLPEWSLVLGLGVAILAAVLTLVARAVGWRVYALAQRSPVLTVFVGGLVIAVVGWGASTWANMSLETVLFDGETGLSDLISSQSAAAIAIVTIGRLIVYGIALGAGFRGGPIFPSLALGVGIGAAVSLFVDPALETPMIVAGIAATVAASLKLPFTAGLLALLVTSAAGAVTAPVAILGGVVGFLIRMAHDKKWPPPEPHATPQVSETSGATPGAAPAT